MLQQPTKEKLYALRLHGMIEAIERPDKRFVLAVQWHPENQSRLYAEQARLFSAFAEALS